LHVLGVAVFITKDREVLEAMISIPAELRGAAVFLSPELFP